MGLLWNEEDPSLPYNRVLAEARLQHLKKRFQRDPELETKYRDVINNYVAKGYARKLSAEEATTKSRHHMVPSAPPSAKPQQTWLSQGSF